MARYPRCIIGLDLVCLLILCYLYLYFISLNSNDDNVTKHLVSETPFKALSGSIMRNDSLGRVSDYILLSCGCLT